MTGLATFALAAGPAGRLSAQGVLNQFSYDNLRPSAIQVDLGVLGSSQLKGALAGGVRVDYGRIAPRVRVLLGVSYFRSEFDREARTRFENRLRQLVDDPTGDAVIDVGRIFWSDFSADIDFQYVFPQGRAATVYLGTGFGVHLRNGSGRAIDGTFVEDALDEVTAGLNATLGAEFHIGPAWRFTFDGRGMLSSGLSTASLRWGLMYRFRTAQGGGSEAR
ncbi:MAG: hypothetical protein ACREMN_13625 [Gemmatimonadales bacterium]